MQGDIEKLSDGWVGINQIVIYGFGLVSVRFIDKILQDFQVAYIIDQNKSGSVYNNIPVVSYDSVKEDLKKKKHKIVVMTSQKNYMDIKNLMNQDGFKEYTDYCRVEQFAVEWYNNNRGQINIIQVNTAVTTWCTLNCKKCNMFMPYYKNYKRHSYSFLEMKEDIDLLMLYVDYIFLYSFLGGEPFLNKELKNIIEYVGEEYKGRIGKLGVTTNGTIIPDEETLLVLQKHNVVVSISDYTHAVQYKDKLVQLVQVLRSYKIDYLLNEMTEWKDFGFPEAPFHWGKDGVHEHMKCCAPLFHGINDKKLYYCHVIWSADKAGIYKMPERDFVDLTKLNAQSYADREKVSKYCMGECERGFMGFCVVCGGCGKDNERCVPAGIQEG